MGKVFLNKQFSNYLGENRAILDTVVSYVSDNIPSPTPSVTSTVTPTPTPTASPGGSTPTPTPTITSTTTATPTPTVTPSASTPPVFQTEYQAILDRAAVLGYTTPSTSEKIRQNQLVIDLKNAGLWTKLGVFYMFALDTTGSASPGFTFINWITPANNPSTLNIYSGSYPTHVSLSGWTFAQNNFMSLGINPNAATVNSLTVTLSGMSEGAYVAAKTGDSTSGSNVMWSTNNNFWNRAFYNNTSSHNIYRSIALTSTYDFTGIGFKGFTINGRPDTDTTAVFTNAGVQTNRTKTGTDSGIAGGTMQINGAASNASFSWTCSMFWSGRLNSTETLSLNNIISSYLQ
jgi:hypothetical protein